MKIGGSYMLGILAVIIALIMAFYKREEIPKDYKFAINWMARGLFVWIIGLFFNCLRYSNCALIENIMQILLIIEPPSSGFSVHGVASFGFIGYWCMSYGISGFIFSRPFLVKKIPGNFFNKKVKPFRLK